MRRERCRHCGGIGRRLHKPLDIVRPNGSKVQSFPYWEDCDACDGTGEAS
jgi:hypothetical protein